MTRKIFDYMKNFIVKNYKVLLTIVGIILITIILIVIINNGKKITPILEKIELGDYDIDLSDKSNFFVTKLNINECSIESNIDVGKVGTYKYKLICPNEKYGPYRVKVVDTTAPSIILKEMIITPGTKIKPEDFFIYIGDLSNYHIDVRSTYDTDSVGAYDVNMVVFDDYGNKKQLVTVLYVEDTAPITTLVCDNLNKVGSVPSKYYVNLNSDLEIVNILRVTEFKYDNPEYYKEDIEHYKSTKLISGIDGDIVIDKKNMMVTFYKYILDIDYKNEFNIKYIPKNKEDILKVFNNSCKSG